MEAVSWIVLIVDATLRVSTPLILAAFAGLFAERSGVVDIGLEGKMLGAAFAAAAAAFATGSPWLGLLAGIGASVALAMVHAFACVTHNGNQVVSGMALNILAAGLGPVLALAWFGPRRTDAHGGGHRALPPAPPPLRRPAERHAVPGPDLFGDRPAATT